MLAAETQSRPAAPARNAPATGMLRLADIASDWLFRECSDDGRLKLLEQHGFKSPHLAELVAEPH